MKKLRFYLSLHTRENDYQVAQAKAAEQIGRKLGIDIEITFAENDAVAQSTQILKAIQSPPDSRPDAILLEPISQIALPQAARAACDAGIAWAVLNRAPEYLSELRQKSKAPIFALTSDHLEIGRIQGKQFAALLPKGGTVLHIEGPSRSKSAQQRTEGMMETKPANIQIAAIKGDWTELSAQRAVRSWLKLATSQRASVNLIGAQDDSMAMGARKAFQELGDQKELQYWLSLPFTGCDGQPATGQAWVQKGLLAATIYLPPLAGQAVDLMYVALHGGTRPPEHAHTKSHSVPPLEVLARRKS